MVNYIIHASLGEQLSYRIAEINDSSAPAYEIAKVISQHYGLDLHIPVIMVCDYYDS